MFVVLIFLIYFLFQQTIFANNFPNCQGLNYSGNLSTNSESIFTYNFEISVSLDSSNSIFPNIITIKNFIWNNLDTSGGFQPIFPIAFNLGISQNAFNCFFENSVCEFNFPNGILHFSMPIQNGSDSSSSIMIGDILSPFFNDGYIFDGNDGSFLLDGKTCRNGSYSDKNITFYQEACCKQFQDVQIVDPVGYDFCSQFETNASFNDPDNNNLSIQLNILYQIISVSDEENEIDIQFKILNSSLSPPSPSCHYMFGANSEFNQCQGDLSTSTNSSCTIKKLMKNDIKEFNMVFMFEFLNSFEKYIIYPEIILGHFISINGTFYKTWNNLYNHDNSCWNKTSQSIPFFDNATYQTSFCCTKFENSIATTTTSTTTTMADITTKNVTLNLNTTTKSTTTTTSVTETISESIIATTTIPLTATTSAATKYVPFIEIIYLIFFCFFICFLNKYI